MVDDILDMFKSDTEPFQSVETKDNSNKPNTNQYGKKEFNLYSSKDYQPLEINTSEFERSGKSFTIVTPDGSTVPEEFLNKLISIVTSLTSNGYTYRLHGDNNNVVQKEMYNVSKRTECYLPWAKYNTDIKEFIRPDYVSYRTALSLRKNFFNLPDAVRAIVSSQVQTILGKKCKDPVNFIIAYSSSGHDLTTDFNDVKFEVEKNLFNVMQIARKAGILYFNIKNDEALTKLKEVLKNAS